MNDRAELVSVYDKIKLVPFGEYVPFDALLSGIGIQKLTHGRGSFAEGVSPRQLLTIPGLPPALALVCYEAFFPGEIVQGAARPGVLINVTNDGWFGNTTGPYQHFYQSRVRAVEEGVPLIRAANNGISAVVDPYGRALQTLGLNVRGVIDSPLPEALAPPLYAKARRLDARPCARPVRIVGLRAQQKRPLIKVLTSTRRGDARTLTPAAHTPRKCESSPYLTVGCKSDGERHFNRGRLPAKRRRVDRGAPIRWMSMSARGSDCGGCCSA